MEVGDGYSDLDVGVLCEEIVEIGDEGHPGIEDWKMMRGQQINTLEFTHLFLKEWIGWVLPCPG